MGFLVLILLINVGISIWNAVSVGKAWPYRSVLSTFQKAGLWSGAVMSAIGFTYTYLIVLAGAAVAAGKLEPEYGQAALSLGFVVIVPALLVSGWIIWAQSMAHAARERSLTSYGIAGWNTFANISNTYHAIRFMPSALGDVGGLFSDLTKGRNRSSSLLAIAIVVMSLAMGVLTAAWIIRSVAHTERQALLYRARTEVSTA